MSSTLKLRSLQDEMEIFILFFRVENRSSNFSLSNESSLSLMVLYIDIRTFIFSSIISVWTWREFKGFLISCDIVEFMRAICYLSIESESMNIFLEISIN